MNELKLGAVDEKFADIVWSSAPISTGELVKRCAAQLNWKRPTVYSALRKFCDNGIFKTEDSTVTVLITKEQLHGMQSAKFVDEVFGGSLPALIQEHFQPCAKLQPDRSGDCKGRRERYYARCRAEPEPKPARRDKGAASCRVNGKFDRDPRRDMACRRCRNSYLRRCQLRQAA